MAPARNPDDPQPGAHGRRPLQLSALALLSGKAVAGWPSGRPIDSEETVAFSALMGIRPRIERFRLDQAEEAFGKVMANRVRFRAVLVM